MYPRVEMCSRLSDTMWKLSRNIHGIRKIRILRRVRTKVLSLSNVQHVKRAAMNKNLLPQNQTQTKAMEAEARPQPLASLSVGHGEGEEEELEEKIEFYKKLYENVENKIDVIERIFEELVKEEYEIRNKYAERKNKAKEEEYDDIELEEGAELVRMNFKYYVILDHLDFDFDLYDADEYLVEKVSQYYSWYIMYSTYIVEDKKTGKKYRVKTRIDKYVYPDGYTKYADPRCVVLEV